MTPSKPRILIVDDDASVQSMLTRMLGRHGYDCESAVNGAVAREMLASTPFDLALFYSSGVNHRPPRVEAPAAKQPVERRM